MRIAIRSKRLKQALSIWWRKYITVECPEDRRDRIRRERIDNIKRGVALLEAVRLPETENEKGRFARARDERLKPPPKRIT